jgi:uncharacterized membrane protein/protein-disulfide isomerase
MTLTAARIALLCALVGLAASSAAAYVHYHMLTDPTYTSACDISETVSCTKVYSSQFGSWRGIPVAIFGGVWFAFAALLSGGALTARQEVRDSIAGYLFAGSTLALAAVLYLGYASFVILQTLCVYCLITYAAVIGLFLVSGAATTIPMLSLPRRAAHDLKLLITSPLAIVLAILWAGGTVSALAMFPREGGASVVEATEAAAPAAASAAATGGNQGQQSELERFMSTAERVPLIIPAEGAKVLIVKFNDFQCPACGQSYLAYKPILAKYAASHPGAVKLVLKDYPLNPDCNSSVRTMLHAGACDAAVAVRLARAKNRGDEMEEWLYSHQQGMTPASVRQAAREVGQVADFDAKYAATLEQVKGDIALGQQLKVTQTPTFFINGVKVDGAWAPQFFDQAIAYELQRAK